MSSILYFPYINIPETSWTVRNLIYYDKIFTIVPEELNSNPKAIYEKKMLELIDADLVQPIDPMDQLNDLRKMNEIFLEFIQSPSYNISQKKDNFAKGNSGLINGDKFKPKKISEFKFDSYLFYYLENLGLAKKDRSGQNWYYVEDTTYHYLMAYLAAILGGKLGILPTTDRISNINFLEKFTKTDNTEIKRTLTLENLIPYPEKISLKKLISFKKKNRNALKLFKTIVEQISLDPNYNDNRLFHNKLEELQYHKEELLNKMNESKLGKIIFGTVFGIASAAIGLATAGTAGAVILGLPGFATTVYSALQYEKPENILDQTGMKYLALLEKRLLD